MTAPVVILLIVGGLAFIGVLVGMSLRAPPEYGPDEIARDPADPIVTTIARKSLVTHPFYEDGVQVARAHTFGLGDTGIVLRLKDDPREILMTTEGEWARETGFGLRPGVRLLLLVDGEPVVEAVRLKSPVVGKNYFRRRSMIRLFEIETAQGRFDFAQLDYGKYALLRGDTVVGIAAMPLLNGFGNRWTSRIELPGSFPLETRVFLALVVKLEDGS